MDMIVVSLVMASMLGMGITFVVMAMREAVEETPTDDTELPPLDYTQYRQY